MKPGEISFIGEGLNRPECAVAHSSGMVFVPDWTGDGGVSAIFPDGRTVRHLARNWGRVKEHLNLDEPLRPNGICLLQGGSFLLAHLGAERGGLFLLHPDGSVEPYLVQLGDKPLPPTNFATVDAAGRCWATVSTRRVPRAGAYRKDVADGFIISIDNGEADIVANELGYANECCLHPDGRRLFVNETFARRLTSFDVDADGNLSNRQTVAEFAPGTFPDGLAFDIEGNAWVTSIISNRLIRVAVSGQVSVIVEDSDAEHLNWVEEAWRGDVMGRPHLDTVNSAFLRNISNLAFCGNNLDQAVLGCLSGNRLAVIDMPNEGFPNIHWTFDIKALISALERKN